MEEDFQRGDLVYVNDPPHYIGVAKILSVDNEVETVTVKFISGKNSIFGQIWVDRWLIRKITPEQAVLLMFEA
jgi:hypothetical protein